MLTGSSPHHSPGPKAAQINIVQILYSGLGGHGSVAFSLESAASKEGTSGCAMVFYGIEPLLSEYEKLCHERGLPYRYVATKKGRAWRSWLELYRSLEQLRPDTIILHSVKAILPCWLYAHMHDIPIMTVEHQNNELKTFTERHISRLLMIFSDAVVVLSPEYLASLKALVGIFWRGDKVHLIPNGIDTVAFAPKPNKQYFAFGRPMRIGMASRFSRIKRHDLLLGALVVLRNRDGTNSWRLSLAGDGETHADICLQAKALDLLEAIELPGYLSEKGLCDWFHSLDFYVHASDGETLSTSLLQAMAMGLPIVGSNVPGIDNLLLAGGGCGLLADLQTPESFAAAITRLATSPALAAELGARARTLAGDEYSQDVMYRRYQEVMHSWLPDHF